MQNDYVEQLTYAGKNSYASLQELGAINTKALQKLVELQFEVASFNIEKGIEQTKLLASTNNYKDYLSAESEFAGDCSNKNLDFTKQAATILSDSRDEIVSWLEKGFESVETKVKAPAKRTTKK
jgi:phasin family protein